MTGPNGAGKTNLLEGLYFGCTGRSCRTNNEREVIRFGAGTTRTVLTCQDEDGPARAHGRLLVGAAQGHAGRRRRRRPAARRHHPSAGQRVPARPARADQRRAGVRRAHLDQFVAALWPARAVTRRSYGQALAQRNALIARIRSGRGSRASLSSWDAQLAEHGIALMSDRRGAVDLIAEPFARIGAELGLARWPFGLLSAALAHDRATRAGRRARGAVRARPRARLHRPRAAPRRAGHRARRPRSAGLRISGAAAAGAARAAAGRARGDRRPPPNCARDAARRRDERARPRPPPGPGRAPSRELRASRSSPPPTSSTSRAGPTPR